MQLLNNDGTQPIPKPQSAPVWVALPVYILTIWYLWYRTSLCPVQARSHGYAASQLVAHLLAAKSLGNCKEIDLK